MKRARQRSAKGAACSGANTRLLTDHVRLVQQHEPALPEEDAVHEMRVATRRLRAALRVLGVRKLDPDVKMLQDALGDVRDLQLQAEWLRLRDAGLYRSSRASLTKAKQALQPALRRWRSHTLPALLEAAADDFALPARKLSKTFRKRLKRLQQRLERARARPTPASLHAARISVKQVRYLVEVAKESLPKRVIRLESDLKTLQASLGELHDVDARIDLVKGKPALVRDQEETRNRLSKIAAAQLTRWHKRRLIDRASAALR
jgi:CHAD domain-containing protein